MKSGRAAKWTARIFRWEELPENFGYTKFLDWEDFRDEFKKEFTPAHVDFLAINRLGSTAYYQKTRPLNNYLDEFQNLITDSGYTNPKRLWSSSVEELTPRSRMQWQPWPLEGPPTQTLPNGTRWPVQWMRTELPMKHSSLPTEPQPPPSTGLLSSICGKCSHPSNSRQPRPNGHRPGMQESAPLCLMFPLWQARTSQ
jgi:hypothetical protein